MTMIILEKIDKDEFSFVDFYVARVKRITPTLFFLLFLCLAFGFFFLAPVEYETLASHVKSSALFYSNIDYWKESGYFDSSSHEKWLLHTWSLSVEWQFYLLYPLFIVFIKNKTSLKKFRFVYVFIFFGLFFYSMLYSSFNDKTSYYLLSTRAWEMMLGGVCYLYPVNFKNKKIISTLSVSSLLLSFFLIDESNSWPDYKSILPMLSVYFLVLICYGDGFLSKSRTLNKIGHWSYSIYLFHWPIVVVFYYFNANGLVSLLGIFLSIVLGFISYNVVEVKFIKVKRTRLSLVSYPVALLSSILVFCYVININNGFFEYSKTDYKSLISMAKPSPLRDKCHIKEYKSPESSCEYFGGNISWATFGDSHTVELAYSLAHQLMENNEGVKQFSFSGCKPSYQIKEKTKCSQWYNDSLEYIINNDNIKNVVFTHRFTHQLLGGDASVYPDFNNEFDELKLKKFFQSIDETIYLLSKNKEKVYITYPIPELPRSVIKLIGRNYMLANDLNEITGTTLDWYENRNSMVIEHFENNEYPKNVIFIDPREIFCDEINCYAVRDGKALYFDDDHPSLFGTEKIANMIVNQE